MAKQIDPIKRIKYKQSRLNNNSICKSLKLAGYADGTAEGMNSNMTVVKICDEEIKQELLAKDMNADYFIKKMERLVINPAKAEGQTDIVRKAVDNQAEYAGIKRSITANITNIYAKLDDINPGDKEALVKGARYKE